MEDTSVDHKRPDMERRIQPVLLTSRLRLVPLSDEHLDFEVMLDADPDVMRFIGNGRPRPREQVEEHHKSRLAAALRVPGLGFWAGFIGPEFIGWWILEPPERPDQGPVDGQAELGYRLLPCFWRKGLAKEGAAELLRYGFEEMHLERVFAETMAVNEASRAAMAAVGLQYEKTLFLEFEEMIPGAELGEVVYSISRSRWLTNRLAADGEQTSTNPAAGNS
jgi:RimJ/RimL family protein N-acetyltransferase